MTFKWLTQLSLSLSSSDRPLTTPEKSPKCNAENLFVDGEKALFYNLLGRFPVEMLKAALIYCAV